MNSFKSVSDRKIQTLFPIVLFSIIILGNLRLVLDSFKRNQSNILGIYGRLKGESNNGVRVVVSPEDRLEEGCDVFEGKWIWDNESYPLYEEQSCPYLVKQTTCLKNGRPDSFYQNWRWQPNGCNLPRFEPLKLLDILRGKRMMFIGDSLQRGQFESMVCLVQSVIPEGKKSLHRVPPMKIFKIEEYNASIEYYWAPFIVESISDHATNHTVHKRMVRLDSIAKHGQHWQGVDILVFESYIWWMHKPFINATYGSPDHVTEYNVTTAYRLALKTWADWLELNINPLTQKLFFMTMSPTHLWSWEWKPGSDENCFNELHPIQDPSYWGTGSNLEIMTILQKTIAELKIDVTLLNITQLSEYRKDAHTTIYGERKGKLLTREQRADPKSFADCIHWCLPGVPDTWNQILYAYLLKTFQNFA
ncbi:hypothetical protein QN277_008811 [Acacia crassicarpa]|uniref:Trichome birefringence-like N-terminal domain-containing protein n=1 Tax=Acacia crassicarpa TaxID=499986 RepID=A0AAE1JML9_9FABA|nr:hypothetical protein QN277_008811 [Acacia crassicarpa]